MNRVLGVFLGTAAQRIGTLRYRSQGARESASFEYDPSWLGHADAFAIEPNLPLIPGPQYHRRQGDGSAFPCAIADTEPDGWARKIILRDHAKRRVAVKKATPGAAHTALNAVDFLLAVDDACRVGALRFQDEDGRFQRASPEGGRTTPPLIALRDLYAATRAVELNTDTAQDLAFLRGRGTALGGLRPKCSILDDDGHLAIGKFPSAQDERAVTKGEVLALHLAHKAGLRAADARLIDSAGVPVALIRRFDRTADGGRHHFVSAATMLGVERNDAQQHYYTEIIDAIRQRSADAQRDILELWRRIAFSILITNIDDHLHNHGFLHVSRGHWQLSPAFDINPFPERARELKTWISEQSGPDATIEALLSIAPYCRLTIQNAKQILVDVANVVSRWRKVGRALGMSAAELDQFADAFEHAEQAAAMKGAG